MTTNAVSGSSPAASLSSLLGATRNSTRKTDTDGDSDSGGGVQGGGGTLYTALLAALTQFVTSHSAGSTGAASTPAATTPAATTPATATPATTGAAGGVPSSLPQDLHAFLHDLFRALRQEGRPRHEDGDSRQSHIPSTPVSATPVPTPVSTTPATTPVTTTSTGTVTTPGVIPVTTPAGTPAAATDTATKASPVTALPGIAEYGQRGLVAELTALIRDLANSGTAPAAVSTPSRVSADTLDDLNAAFAKLIGDLGGTVSGASTGTATSSATATASHADTSALQSFLANFLHDLKGNAASAAGTLGNGVNVTV